MNKIVILVWILAFSMVGIMFVFFINGSDLLSHNLEGIGTPVRSHQYIGQVDLNSRTVWFCPVTDHGSWLCGNYSLADWVTLPSSVQWYNETNVVVSAYWDGTYYTDNGQQWKHLMPLYGNRSTLEGWVYATLLNRVVIKLEPS
jgi:hypothetical protein